jgi:hypothetical protein
VVYSSSGSTTAPEMRYVWTLENIDPEIVPDDEYDDY